MRGGAVLLFASLAIVAASSAGRAQVTFSLTPANESYTTSASAQTVDYFGTISNLGSSTIYLNDIEVNIDPAFSASATANTNLFFGNVPASLNPFGTAGSSYSGVVFGIDLGATNVSAPSFSGNASLEGGTTDSSLSSLGTIQQFLGMPISGSAVPEPCPLLLVGCGMLGTVRFASKRRRPSKTSVSKEITALLS